MSPHRNNGFTIVELVVSLMLFVMIMAGASTAFTAIRNAMERSGDTQESLQIGRAVLDDIIRDLEDFYPVEVDAAVVQQSNPNMVAPEGGKYILFFGQDNQSQDRTRDEDAITFITASNNPQDTPPPSFDLMETAYSITVDDDSGRLGLIKTSNPLPGLAVEGYEPDDELITDRIRSLNLRYYDAENGEWVDEWETSPPLPTAVEVTLSVSPPTEDEDDNSDAATPNDVFVSAVARLHVTKPVQWKTAEDLKQSGSQSGGAGGGSGAGAATGGAPAQPAAGRRR